MNYNNLLKNPVSRSTQERLYDQSIEKNRLSVKQTNPIRAPAMVVYTVGQLRAHKRAGVRPWGGGKYAASY